MEIYLTENGYNFLRELGYTDFEQSDDGQWIVNYYDLSDFLGDRDMSYAGGYVKYDSKPSQKGVFIGNT